MPETICILGAGRVACALAVSLRQSASVSVWSRRAEHPLRPLFKDGIILKTGALPLEIKTAEVAIICVNDDAIEEVSRNLLQILDTPPDRYNGVVLHTSGLQSSDTLRKIGFQCPVASLHPLVSIPHQVDNPSFFQGRYFAMEGDPSALNRAKTLVDNIEGLALTIPSSSKPVYHLSATMASNYLVTLADISIKLLQSSGISKDVARILITSLMSSSIDNLFKEKPEAILTGPIVRGDCDTVRAHLDLCREDPALEALYKLLGSKTLDIAHSSLPEEILLTLSDLFSLTPGQTT